MMRPRTGKDPSSPGRRGGLAAGLAPWSAGRTTFRDLWVLKPIPEAHARMVSCPGRASPGRDMKEGAGINLEEVGIDQAGADGLGHNWSLM